MRRIIAISLLLLCGMVLAVFHAVRAQSPPILPTINFYATYPFHVLKHPTGVSAEGIYLWISDSDNNVVRQFLSSTGTLSVLAGSGTRGFVNGSLTSAEFYRPTGIKGRIVQTKVCPQSCQPNCFLACERTYTWAELHVNDAGNYASRLVCSGVAAPSGYPCSNKSNQVSTFMGAPTPPVKGHVDGNVSVAKVAELGDLLSVSNNLFYIADAGNQSIRAFDLTNVSTYAGTGQQGLVNGFRTNALFNFPTSVTTDASNLYITDTGNHVIRKIDTAGNVTTLAGTGEPGYIDGVGSQAEFYRPTNVVWYSGYGYIADSGNNMIRRVDATGNVTTYAGATTPGLVNGTLSQARFNSPTAIAIYSGFMFVSDTLNNCIRRIDMAIGVVSTYIN